MGPGPYNQRAVQVDPDTLSDLVDAWKPNPDGLYFSLYVPWRPVPKQSPQYGAGIFTPKRVREAEKTLRRLIQDRMLELGLTRPYLGEIKMHLVVYLKPEHRAEAEWIEAGHDVQMCSTPDLENIVKLINDAAQGPRGLFLNDAQVSTQVLTKQYRIGPERFWIGYYCREPSHPNQVRKRVRAFYKAQHPIRRKRKEPETLCKLSPSTTPPPSYETQTNLTTLPPIPASPYSLREELDWGPED